MMIKYDTQQGLKVNLLSDAPIPRIINTGLNEVNSLLLHANL